MDIVQRNLFRLLRSGTFQTTETIEPMSAFKWTKLYQLSVLHQIVPFVYQGINHCNNQFFLQLTSQQREEWEKAIREQKTDKEQEMEENEFLRPDHLTNPLLNRRLQTILDDEHSDITTRRQLLILIRIVRHLLNEGIPIRQLTELGISLRANHGHADYNKLNQWIDSLRLTEMGNLAGEFLILLMSFDEKEIPFLRKRREKEVQQLAEELIRFTAPHNQDWYFSQEDGDIFVHSSNSSAAFSHVRRSARYFRYYPSESLTNFFASFVHSISHIEE